MSKLEKLIQQYCPDGVEWIKIKDIAQVGTGSSNGNEADEDGKYPFFVRSQIVKSKNDFEYDEEAIIIPGEGGIGDIFHYINGKYALHQRVYRIHFTTQQINVKFAFYYMKSAFKRFIMTKAVSATVTSIRKPMIEDFEIPVPPLPVQEEIVRILDTFTELQAELQKRLQQYNYYRDNLLSVYSDSNTVRILELQQCVSPDCSMSYGVVQPGEDFIGGIPVVRPVDLSGRIIHNKGIKTVKPILLKAYSRTELKGGELLVCVRGTTGVVAFAGEDLKGGNVTRGIVPLRFNPLVNSNYMYHLFNSRFVKKQIENKTQGAALQQINVGDLKKISIPVPPFEEQNRIVSILDRFDTLTNDLTSGLPAEIEKRRQQYEFYRDKLLTFKRKEA